MNDRIKELMIQAGFDPASIERMGVMPNAEKFVKLLVKECMKLGDKALQDGKWPGDVLKEHFGVKE